MDPNHPIAYFHPNKKNLAFHKIATLSTVTIDYEQWKKFKLSITITNIQTWNVEKFSISGVRKVPIIQTISATTFPSLTSLILSNNHIESIEGIGRLITPGLLVLKLNENRLVSVDELAKAYFPSLKELYIANNFLRNGEQLAKLKSKKLKVIEIERAFSSLQLDSIQWVIKLETTKLSALYMQGGIKYLKLNKPRLKKNLGRNIMGL